MKEIIITRTFDSNPDAKTLQEIFETRLLDCFREDCYEKMNAQPIDNN